jgi:hypothetical protein
MNSIEKRNLVCFVALVAIIAACAGLVLGVW